MEFHSTVVRCYRKACGVWKPGAQQESDAAPFARANFIAPVSILKLQKAWAFTRMVRKQPGHFGAVAMAIPVRAPRFVSEAVRAVRELACYEPQVAQFEGKSDQQ